MIEQLADLYALFIQNGEFLRLVDYLKLNWRRVRIVAFQFLDKNIFQHVYLLVGQHILQFLPFLPFFHHLVVI